MFQLGMSLSSMLGGYSQEEWTPLLIYEKMAGHRDAQSHALCKLNQNNCKTKLPLGLLLVGGTRCYEQAMD